MGCKHGLDPFHAGAGELGEDEFLLREVVEEGSAADAGLLGDLVGGGGVKALAGEQGEGGAGDVAGGFGAAAVAEGEGGLWSLIHSLDYSLNYSRWSRGAADQGARRPYL